MASPSSTAPTDEPAPAGRAAVAPGAPDAPDRPLREALVIFGISTLACFLLHRLRGLPLVGDHLHTLVAAVFIYLPTAMLYRQRRDFGSYGISPWPLKKNLIWYGLLVAAVLPVFCVGFFFYQRLLCEVGLATQAVCARLLSKGPIAIQWPDGMLSRAAAQLLVVAIPEELFYRGYLMTRLDHAIPPRWKILGAQVGPALLIQAALFGLGHFLVDFDPRRLGVAFPALLFGFLRARTGSIGASALFHATCNLTMEVLVKTAFH
jgi:membrane protease YdiL (CAAX protease family)